MMEVPAFLKEVILQHSDGRRQVALVDLQVQHIYCSGSHLSSPMLSHQIPTDSGDRRALYQK